MKRFAHTSAQDITPTHTPSMSSNIHLPTPMIAPYASATRLTPERIDGADRIVGSRLGSAMRFIRREDLARVGEVDRGSRTFMEKLCSYFFTAFGESIADVILRETYLARYPTFRNCIDSLLYPVSSGRRCRP